MVKFDSLTLEKSKYLNYRYLRANHSSYEEPHFRLLPPDCHVIFDSYQCPRLGKRHAFAKAYFGAGAYYMPTLNPGTVLGVDGNLQSFEKAAFMTPAEILGQPISGDTQISM